MAGMPNPFSFVASDAAADSAAASMPQCPCPVDAAAAIHATSAHEAPGYSGSIPPAATPDQQPCWGASPISDIAEIFAGARKLFDPDPAAYTNQDEVYYDLLRQMDDPHTADLIAIPAGMWLEFDPPPLFLREAS